MYTEPPAPAAGVHCRQEPFGLHLSVSPSRFATYYSFQVDLGIRFSPSTTTIIVIKQASSGQYKSRTAAQSSSGGYSFLSGLYTALLMSLNSQEYHQHSSCSHTLSTAPKRLQQSLCYSPIPLCFAPFGLHTKATSLPVQLLSRSSFPAPLKNHRTICLSLWKAND